MSERSAPFTLTPEVAADAAALARLLTGLYREEAGGGQPLPDAELGKRLAAAVPAGIALADWAAVRLDAGEALTPCQRGMLAFTDQLLDALLATPAFHPRIAEPLRAARGALAAAALPVDGWITNPRHPVRALLATLHAQACGWHPELGPPAAALHGQWQQWLSAGIAGERSWLQLNQDIIAWQQAEDARRQRLEQRLVEAEAGLVRSRHARQLAARILNQAMAGRQVPPDAARALHEDWFPAMQWALLQEGEHGQLWQRVKRLTGTLRWTLQPDEGSDATRNKLFRLVAQANEDLEALAAHMIRDEVARTRMLAAIDAAHTAAISGQDLAREPFPPVDAQDPLADGNTEVSRTLLAGVQSLAVGSWFLLQEPGGQRRIRLLLRHDDTGQLLFANALGARALQASFGAFALRLASGEACLLPAAPDVEGIIGQLRAGLQQQFEQQQQQRLESIRVARARAAAEAREKELARQKALAEAEQLEKARQAALGAARASEQAASAAALDAQQQRRQRARLLASSLTLGSWLDFIDGDTTVRRRLTVVLPSSGKYILVDVDGTGKFEITRDELVAGLADGSIAPLDRNQRIDDALTRVVDNLRNAPGSNS